MDSVMEDNDGYKPCEEIIYEGENNALFTTMPIKQLHKALADFAIPAKISNSAGLYVCNRTYYGALRLCNERAIKAIFVHLPLFENQTSDSANAKKMPLVDMVKAIEIIINRVTIE
jgi:pyroglutamyl-peptidase